MIPTESEIENWINDNEIGVGNHLAINSFTVRDYVIPIVETSNELLQSLIECLEGVEELNGEYQEGWDEVIEKAKSVIAKAKGE